MSGLAAFSRGQVRRRASSPKLVLWNNALISALGSPSLEDALAAPDWWGRLVENAAGAHLLNGLQPAASTVHYWRRDGDEVDFVVTRGTKVCRCPRSSRRRPMSSSAPEVPGGVNQSRIELCGPPGTA